MVALRTDPKALLIAGDWHGDFMHAAYCIDQALRQRCDAIVQVGDFGYWEHHPSGVDFLDQLSLLADENDMPIYWLDGNHENFPLLWSTYGPGGPKHKLVEGKFWEIRPNLYYLPRGVRWSWNGVRFLALGGAYSVDKAHRLNEEKKALAANASKNEYRRAAGKPEKPINPSYKQWWAEEQITEAQVAEILKDRTPIDIMFTHDKPFASNPRWTNKDIPATHPNQQLIQEVCNALQPVMLFHGHLHHPYEDAIRVGDDDKWCIVHSLHCNTRDQFIRVGPKSSWMRLSLEREN